MASSTRGFASTPGVRGSSDDVTSDSLFARLYRNRHARIGGSLVLLVATLALVGPALAPYRYDSVDMSAVWARPGAEHLLGTDGLGRDVLSRFLVGARVSLTVALAVIAVTLVVGVAVGLVAGYRGGVIDTLAMRSCDIVFAFPELILAIIVASVLGPGKLTVIVSLSLVWWPGIARLTRSLVLSMKREPFIDAARVSGTGTPTILLTHILPNVAAPILVRASVGVGFIIIAEATLSFLGLGVQEPEPTWGGMIRDGIDALRTDPHLALIASLGLAVTIVGFNFLGDGIRDLLDPREESR
jgi:ABC-type dipeptide/oligopeptide/nickel transport system permease subunit